MRDKKIILQFEDQENEDNKYAYVYFKQDLKDNSAGESKRQITYDGFGSEEAKQEGVEMIIDFDKDNKIIGIEIISNRDIIPDNLKK